MKIRVKSKSNGSAKQAFDKLNIDRSRFLRGPGTRGLQKLKSATPRRTGKSSEAWSMDIEKDSSGPMLTYYNDNVTRDGVPVVVLLKNGHGTGTGGYVRGNDFITPIVDQIIADVSRSIL